MADYPAALANIFSELLDGPTEQATALNSGDIGLLRSLDRLSAADASRSVDDGATIAYHLGAIRQIGKTTRGPRQGTFTVSRPK